MLDAIGQQFNLSIDAEQALVGGAALEQEGTALSADTLKLARGADGVLFGSVGGPKWDGLPIDQRPEKGLLRLREGLDLFANLRPAILYP